MCIRDRYTYYVTDSKILILHQKDIPPQPSDNSESDHSNDYPESSENNQTSEAADVLQVNLAITEFLRLNKFLLFFIQFLYCNHHIK